VRCWLQDPAAEVDQLERDLDIVWGLRRDSPWPAASMDDRYLPVP
jgi:hypothetical protein